MFNNTDESTGEQAIRPARMQLIISAGGVCEGAYADNLKSWTVWCIRSGERYDLSVSLAPLMVDMLATRGCE